eukprot:c23000_g1_i2 orf=416-1213(-)
MAQYMGSLYWWQAGLHQHIASHHALLSMQTLSSLALRSFLSRTAWEDLVLLRSHPDSATATVPCLSITCFRDDELPLPEHLLDRDMGNLSLRTKLEIRYSPWALSMMNVLGRGDGSRLKEFTGGPAGGGRGDGDGGGEGGGGGGDNDGEERVFLLPLLTIAFAAFHLGYCIAVWMKDESLHFDFVRTGLGLFCLLVVAAIRLNNLLPLSRTGVDAYLLGLGASVGVMIWTGERCLVKKDDNPAGVVALFAAAMSVIFTAALYDDL